MLLICRRQGSSDETIERVERETERKHLTHHMTVDPYTKIFSLQHVWELLSDLFQVKMAADVLHLYYYDQFCCHVC